MTRERWIELYCERQDAADETPSAQYDAAEQLASAAECAKGCDGAVLLNLLIVEFDWNLPHTQTVTRQYRPSDIAWANRVLAEMRGTANDRA